MSQPEFRGLIHSYSPLLTTLAISYIPKQTDYIAKDLFPGVPVANSFGIYKKIPRGAFLRPVAKKLANKEAAPLGGFEYQEANFNVETYGLATDWTDRDLNAADVGGIGSAQLIRHKTLYVTQQALLRREIDTAALVRLTGSWTVNYTGVASAPSSVQFIKWSDYTGSDPVADVLRWKEDFKLRTGFYPNVLMLAPKVWRSLSQHPDLMDRVKYGGNNDRPATVTLQAVAGLFEIEKIIIPGGVVNSAEEGQADVIGYIWGDDCWIGYVSDAPSTETPSAGYHFLWTGAGVASSPVPFQGQVNNEGMHIRRYIDQRTAAYYVESRLFSTANITAADLGSTIKSVI